MFNAFNNSLKDEQYFYFPIIDENTYHVWIQ